MKTLQNYIDKLSSFNSKEMYGNDSFPIWEKTDEELEAVWTVTDALRFMRGNNISTKVLENGPGISLFCDNPTRTRSSFASICSLLGLGVQDLNEGKSQVAHGEAVHETVDVISFVVDVIGIRDNMYIGKDNACIHEIVDAVTQGHKDGTLEQKPTLANLQCDINHPTQRIADMLHIICGSGDVKNLEGKKLAMTRVYSPPYGKSPSVPQDVVGLMTRIGMEVVLARPGGYKIIPEVEGVAGKNTEKTGGSFRISHDITDAFKDVDIVYPENWAPFAVMEKRTDLYAEGNHGGIKALEKELLTQDAEHKDWCYTEELMKTVKDGKTLYLHYSPTDTDDVSCEDDEAEVTVFDRYHGPLYKEASCKPYVVATMIVLAKFVDPADILERLEGKRTPRVLR